MKIWKENKIFVLLICQLLICQLVLGQELLSLEEAINVGLENNYNIRIAKNNETIADNQNTSGNAGFLPRVSLNGDIDYSSNNSAQQFFNGESQVRNGAGNTAFRGGLAIDWTAFDGFKMFATKERLELLEEKSQEFTKREMQNLVYQIKKGYADLIRINEQIENIETSIELNQSLLDLVEAKLGLGATTRLEVLQSTNRVKADSAQLLNIENEFKLSKVGFNRLLRVSPHNDFKVSENYNMAILPAFDEALNLALNENYELSLLSYDEKITLAQIKEAKSALYPTLDLNAGFNYNWSKSEAGFLLSNRTFGPTIGATLNYNIFTGRDLKKDIANVEILQENISLGQNALAADIENDLAAYYQSFIALEQLKTLETTNLKTAEQNTALARELYRSGRATNFEVREAIYDETRVKDRLSDVRYRQKLVQIDIYYTVGML